MAWWWLWLAGGLKYSSQCSPGRGTDTPWQLEARERHARWTHIFYPTEKPSSLVPPSVEEPRLLRPQRSFPLGACSRFRPHRPPAELVASVPFSKPIQNLSTTAAPLLSLSSTSHRPARHLEFTLRYVTLCRQGGDGQRQGLIKPTLHRHS